MALEIDEGRSPHPHDRRRAFTSRRWGEEETRKILAAYAAGNMRLFRELLTLYERTEAAARMHMQRTGFVRTVKAKRIRGGKPKGNGMGREVTDLKRRPGEPEPTGAEGGCQWLHGHEHARFFCGAPKASSSPSWCDFHLRRVFRLGERPPK